VQVRVGQYEKPASGEAFDIRVVAFAAAQAATLRGLQELFGVDAATALHIFESVPTIVRRGVAAHDAQAYVSALQSLGARVTLERPAAHPNPPAVGDVAAAGVARRPPPPPPAPARARPAPPPVPRAAAARDERVEPSPHVESELPLPRPIMRALTADLEFDIFGGQGTDGSLPPALGASVLDTEDTDTHERTQGQRNPRRQEIELDASGSSNALDLDPTATAPRLEPSPRDQAAHGTLPAPNPPRSAPGARAARSTDAQPAPDPQRGAAMSRAAVVQRPAASNSTASRQLALLQILCATAVIVAGVWLDNTIIYGNASHFSVVVHGLALQQFGWGVWKLRR